MKSMNNFMLLNDNIVGNLEKGFIDVILDILCGSKF